MVELLEWCQMHGMRAPTYIHHGEQNKFQAVVTLASSISYQGSWTHDKEQASESAAAVALVQMVSARRRPLAHVISPCLTETAVSSERSGKWSNAPGTFNFPELCVYSSEQ